MRFSVTVAENTSMKVPVLLSGDPSAIRLAKELRYDACELHFDSADALVRSGLLSTLQAQSMEVSALATGRGYTKSKLSLIDEDAHVRKRAVMFMSEFIELAEKLKAHVIVGCIRGNLDDRRNEEEQVNLLAQALRKLSSFAKTRGVSLVIEAINRYENNYLNTITELQSFIERYDLENVKILIDSFHMNIEEGDIHQSIIEAHESIGYVHVADSNRWPPGKGHFCFESFFKGLKDIHYKGYISAECLPLPSGEEAAEQWITSMKTMERQYG